MAATTIDMVKICRQKKESFVSGAAQAVLNLTVWLSVRGG